jgi:hypothetical protein
MPERAQLPWWLKPLNRAIVALQRLGLVFGPMHLLSVPGRKSGELRTTPVSPLAVADNLYIVAGLDGAAWVKDARAARWGILARGRKQERVRLVELPPEERGPVLREFPLKVPGGVQFFRRLYGVSPDPDEFAALAPQCPVFRVEEVRR